MTQNQKTAAAPQIVKRVAVTETLRNMEPGTAYTFHSADFANYYSVASSVCRLNAEAGREEFAVSTEDNGATYTVSRAAAPTTIRRKQTDRSR